MPDVVEKSVEQGAAIFERIVVGESGLGMAEAKRGLGPNTAGIARANTCRYVRIAGEVDVDTEESDSSFQMNVLGRRDIWGRGR